jgi:hypothetical protein
MTHSSASITGALVMYPYKAFFTVLCFVVRPVSCRRLVTNRIKYSGYRALCFGDFAGSWYNFWHELLFTEQLLGIVY